MFLLYFLAFELALAIIGLIAFFIYLVSTDEYVRKIRRKLESPVPQKYEVFFDEEKLVSYTLKACFHNSGDLFCAHRYFAYISNDNVSLYYVIGRREMKFDLSPKEIFLLLENVAIDPPYTENIIQFADIKRGAK